MTTDTPTPKSYMSAEQREDILKRRGQERLYIEESNAAGRAGDEDTAWAWLSFVELSARSLMSLKRRTSAQFIREMNLRTTKADAAYGPGWLDA